MRRRFNWKDPVVVAVVVVVVAIAFFILSIPRTAYVEVKDAILGSLSLSLPGMPGLRADPGTALIT